MADDFEYEFVDMYEARVQKRREESINAIKQLLSAQAVLLAKETLDESSAEEISQLKNQIDIARIAVRKAFSKQMIGAEERRSVRKEFFKEWNTNLEATHARAQAVLDDSDDEELSGDALKSMHVLEQIIVAARNERKNPSRIEEVKPETTNLKAVDVDSSEKRSNGRKPQQEELVDDLA